MEQATQASADIEAGMLTLPEAILSDILELVMEDHTHGTTPAKLREVARDWARIVFVQKGRLSLTRPEPFRAGTFPNLRTLGLFCYSGRSQFEDLEAVKTVLARVPSIENLSLFKIDAEEVRAGPSKPLTMGNLKRVTFFGCCSWDWLCGLHLPALDTLTLSGTDFDDLEAAASLQGLRTLIVDELIGDTKWEDMSPEEWGAMRENAFEEDYGRLYSVAGLSSLQSLEYLDLTFLVPCLEGLDEIGSLSQLTFLSLRIRVLEPDDLTDVDFLTHLSGLRSLVLGGFEGVASATYNPPDLSGLSNLTSLEAAGSSAYICLPSLTSLSSLQSLTVRFSEDSGAPHLEQALLRDLPQCANLTALMLQGLNHVGDFSDLLRLNLLQTVELKECFNMWYLGFVQPLHCMESMRSFKLVDCNHDGEALNLVWTR